MMIPVTGLGELVLDVVGVVPSVVWYIVEGVDAISVPDCTARYVPLAGAGVTVGPVMPNALVNESKDTAVPTRDIARNSQMTFLSTEKMVIQSSSSLELNI